MLVIKTSFIHRQGRLRKYWLKGCHTGIHILFKKKVSLVEEGNRKRRKYLGRITIFPWRPWMAFHVTGCSMEYLLFMPYIPPTRVYPLKNSTAVHVLAKKRENEKILVFWRRPLKTALKILMNCSCDFLPKILLQNHVSQIQYQYVHRTYYFSDW